MSEQALKLLQGTLDVLVLKALDDGSAHGYAIVEWIRAITDGRIAIEDGALYNSLHRMEKRRWVESRWGLSDNNRRAKFYRLTRKGRKQLQSSTDSWANYADAVFQVLGAGVTPEGR